MPIDAVPCPHQDCVDIRDTGKPEADVLHCSAAQWAEFLAAIKAGKFDAVGSPDQPARLPAGIGRRHG
jgi:hypothetical protein